jgi:hypothetical protein
MNIFQVKSKPGNEERISEFVKNGFVAIGWTETGSLKGADKETIRQKLIEMDYDGQSLLTNLGTVNAFVNTMGEKGVVLVTEGDSAHIGIYSEYEWKHEYIDIRCAHLRRVTWKAKVKKTELNAEVQSLLRNGTSVTKFKHPFHVAELNQYFDNDGVPSNNDGSPDSKPVILEQYNDLAEKTLKAIEKLLDSDNEQIKLEAAKEILRFLKK